MYIDPILSQGQYNQSDPAWSMLGFKFGDKGAHTSRTMMLAELTTVLRQLPPTAARDDYARVIVEENCLGKHTRSTRRLSLQRLSELYGLDPAIPLFRLLRVSWDADGKSQPLLAMLVALARDPLLRATAPVVLGMKDGEELARQQMTDALREAVGGRLNDNILDKVVRNTASSWTQSGHLTGRSRKRRTKVEATPCAAAFALLLGFLLGSRGKNLFETIFSRVLDREEGDLSFLAMDAKRLGFLDIKSSGGITVISFDQVLSEQEKRMSHGTN